MPHVASRHRNRQPRQPDSPETRTAHDHVRASQRSSRSTKRPRNDPFDTTHLERLDESDADGRRYRLTVDLPPDFALNQPLSTFALAAVEVLDPASETYALDVVSVIEATLEDPRQILAAQLNKARGEAVAQMKAEGIEYDERMELLEEVTYSRPLDELLGHAFEVYLQSNPGPLTRSCRRSPSCARCGSGR